MSIKIHNFMGKLGWNARKYLPNLASGSYLKLLFITRRKLQKDYVNYFLSKEEAPQPLIVNIETINRCNSTCAFCTANKNAEKRPFMKMDEELFKHIIDDLAAWDYKGHLTLYGNNEPWLDTRIVELHKYAREKLPNAFIFMSTNGLILKREHVDAIKPYVDQLIINNYCMDMKLHDNIQEIYDYVRAHEDEYKDLDILIQMRYLQEVLTNRAGSAPNKKATNKIIKERCLMPYTDMWIMPNGKLGICCCDNFEVTELADLNKVSVRDGWNSDKYKELRLAVKDGRHGYPFCKYCDFTDGGLRMDSAKNEMNGMGQHNGARQSFRKNK